MESVRPFDCGVYETAASNSGDRSRYLVEFVSNFSDASGKHRSFGYAGFRSSSVRVQRPEIDYSRAKSINEKQIRVPFTIRCKYGWRCVNIFVRRSHDYTRINRGRTRPLLLARETPSVGVGALSYFTVHSADGVRRAMRGNYCWTISQSFRPNGSPNAKTFSTNP